MKINDLGLFVDTECKNHTVLEYIEQIPFTPKQDGKTSYRNGLKDYKTAAGIELKRTGDTFQTLDGKVLSPVKTD